MTPEPRPHESRTLKRWQNLTMTQPRVARRLFFLCLREPVTPAPVYHNSSSMVFVEKAERVPKADVREIQR